MTTVSRRLVVAGTAAIASPVVSKTIRRHASAALEATLFKIKTIDHAGPMLNSVLAVSAVAMRDAIRIDRDQAQSPLHGVPILVKDNIDGMATTIGSLALVHNLATQDAPVIARLRSAGAVIVGKANLSEWANIRGAPSIGGWSAVGGLTRNPHVLDRTADGSSSGSAVAVAAGLVPIAIGTETDGSIVDPASMNGVVGMKPTIGSIPTMGVAPVSSSQDTVGAMSRDVRTLATVMSFMAGRPLATALTLDGLRGKRLGVARWTLHSGAVDDLFEVACHDLRGLGATLVELNGFRPQDILGADELHALLTELRVNVDAYLKTRTAPIPVRSLAEVVAFNRQTPRELALFGQSLFEAALKTNGLKDGAYLRARHRAEQAALTNGLAKLFEDHNLDLLVGPTNGPAPMIDLAFASTKSSRSLSQMPAIAGWPHLTVPMGRVMRLPIGLSMIGPKGQDASLLSAGYAYEQATRRFCPPAFLPTLLADPEISESIRPKG